MKIVQINATCTSGSTGKICLAVSRLLSLHQIENYILHTQSDCHELSGQAYASRTYVKLNALYSRLKGNYGFNSVVATKRLIDHLERIQPTVVHLHNLHSHNCHLGLLFSYFKDKKIKLYWTFHDCWEFTGYCPYFDMVDCDKWKTGCHHCPQKKKYSWIFDRSRWLYEQKKELFQGLDLTIITPSQWLGDLVKQSFLKEYPVQIINNGIDLSIFWPRESDFRLRYGCENKKVILGVAFDWDARKGLDVFIELAKRLDEAYQIVLVGMNDKIDQQLPDSIISIQRTQNQAELAEIYTAADVFVNPTREENYPTVNMEALACGTPVLTFDTGGSAEMLDETCGAVVPKNDVDALEEKIRYICTQDIIKKSDCLLKADSFDQNKKFYEYLKLYGAMK